MPFTITARTILQLGAELISSDAIAFYELIKNAFDAGSPRVEVNIVIRMPHPIYRRLCQFAQCSGKIPEENREITLIQAIETVLQALDYGISSTSGFADAVKSTSDWQSFYCLIGEANYIEIIDTGEGMSLEDLRNKFLVVGTQHRLKQRNAATSYGLDDDNVNQPKQSKLGEKGVGRLSVMRLGDFLSIETSKAGESNTNLLSIDWSAFDTDDDVPVSAIAVEPEIGSVKQNPESSGTTIHVSALHVPWNVNALIDIARTQFSKLTDPFTPADAYPIVLRFNSKFVEVPKINKLLFEHAHAVVDGEFRVGPTVAPSLIEHIKYKQLGREGTFQLNLVDLLSIGELDNPSLLHSLGPFKFKLYWYNRRILTEIESIGNLKAVRDLVAQWSGGFMIFRDGFRVYPYGGPNDDWLDLDRMAFAASGFKANRAQIIGAVRISRTKNPHLIDQTNREGFRDNDEKLLLRKLLRNVIDVFRTFLDRSEAEAKVKEPATFDDLEHRVRNEERVLQDSFASLIVKHPIVSQDQALVNTIRKSLQTVREYVFQLKELADSYDRGRTQLVNLAGVGLMIEVVAHELNRATNYTIGLLANIDTKLMPIDQSATLKTLGYQLETIVKRLKILDPMSTAGRQNKEKFDLTALVQEVLQSHEAQFLRHNIKTTITSVLSDQTWQVKLVKGMIVQILENLISNSVYWLKQQEKLAPNSPREIRIVLDRNLGQISFSDNGPGIDPQLKEEVFAAFVTHKPPGEGKGLGLYISKEVAKYQGSNLYLADERTIHSDRLNTFILELGKTS